MLSTKCKDHVYRGLLTIKYSIQVQNHKEATMLLVKLKRGTCQ